MLTLISLAATALSKGLGFSTVEGASLDSPVARQVHFLSLPLPILFPPRMFSLSCADFAKFLLRPRTNATTPLYMSRTRHGLCVV